MRCTALARRLFPVLVLAAAVLAPVAVPTAAPASGGGRYGTASSPPECLYADAAAANYAAIEEALATPIWSRGILRVLRDFVQRMLDHRWLLLHDCVRMNQIQVLGTHNSYHVEPDPILVQQLGPLFPDIVQLEYTHVPLAQQFSGQGIRKIELDVWTDPQGGLFAHRLADVLLGNDPWSQNPDMYLPGFKTIHIPDLDYVSTCETFVACLGEVKAWSDTHPGHLPIAIMVELKDDPPILPGGNLAQPLPIGADDLDALDAEIRSVFPLDRMIEPDDVRGPRTSLEDAVLLDGWPTLGESRGKVIFLMDNGGAKRDLYRAGRPSLDGRVLFTNAIPGDADAAFVKLNDAQGDEDVIRDTVAAGYLVRTRADADTAEARSGDVSTRDAALRSGGQLVSTDYPVPDPRFGTGYFVAIPGGRPARCNPVNAPTWCDATLLER
jgi:hypothetical protein